MQKTTVPLWVLSTANISTVARSLFLAYMVIFVAVKVVTDMVCGNMVVFLVKNLTNIHH